MPNGTKGAPIGSTFDLGFENHPRFEVAHQLLSDANEQSVSQDKQRFEIGDS